MITLSAGDKAPDFKAVDQDCNTHTLQDYKGKKLVVFFYPKASTPGCTAEACNLRDNWTTFQSQNYALLGVSADSEKRQSNFKNKYEFPFPLLADEEKEVMTCLAMGGAGLLAKGMFALSFPEALDDDQNSFSEIGEDPSLFGDESVDEAGQFEGDAKWRPGLAFALVGLSGILGMAAYQELK